MYITGKFYSALRKSPIEVWALVTKAGQFKSVEEIFILYWGSGQDASLSYKKSSNLFTYLGRASSNGRDEKVFKEVCLNYIFGSWREREFTRAKFNFRNAMCVKLTGLKKMKCLWKQVQFVGLMMIQFITFEFLWILEEVQGIIAFWVLLYRNYFIFGTWTFILRVINYTVMKCS